jgi:hypothetical protein
MNKKGTALVAASAQENKADKWIVARTPEENAIAHEQHRVVRELYLDFFGKHHFPIIFTDTDADQDALREFGKAYENLCDAKPGTNDFIEAWKLTCYAAQALYQRMKVGSVAVYRVKLGGAV